MIRAIVFFTLTFVTVCLITGAIYSIEYLHDTHPIYAGVIFIAMVSFVFTLLMVPLMDD